MPQFHVTTADLVVLIGYVIGTRILFGWYFARKTRRAGDSSEACFLTGRDIRSPIIGLSFYVSNMSGSSFVGLPGSGYHDGIAVFNYEWLPRERACLETQDVEERVTTIVEAALVSELSRSVAGARGGHDGAGDLVVVSTARL